MVLIKYKKTKQSAIEILRCHKNMLYYKCLKRQRNYLVKRKGMIAVIPFLNLEETTDS